MKMLQCVAIEIPEVFAKANLVENIINKALGVHKIDANEFVSSQVIISAFGVRTLIILYGGE